MFGNKKPTPPVPPEALTEGEGQPLPENDAEAPLEGGSEAQLRVVELEGELAKIKDQMLRTAAEAENTRRRMEREMEDARKYAVTDFARDLLAAADNLRRAIEALPADQRDSSPAMKNLLIGVEATEKQLLGAFEKNGVQPVEALNQTFDPNFHQAMQEVEDASVSAGTVVQVFQKGYTIADRLLRPALVVVAKAPPGRAVDTEA